MILFKFERRIAILKVTGQRRESQLSCLGRGAEAALPVAQTLLQRGQSFLSRMVEGAQVGLTLLCCVDEEGSGDKGHERKAKQVSELCPLQNSFFFPPEQFGFM